MTTAPNKPTPAAMAAARKWWFKRYRMEGREEDVAELAHALDAFAAKAVESQVQDSEEEAWNWIRLNIGKDAASKFSERFGDKP